MIEVRVNNAQSGRLTHIAPKGSSFVYGRLFEPELAVSMTMPVQPQSYDWDYGLLPIFEMNLPEGALRAHLQARFAKALGTFDDLDLLAITGRHQIGRIEYGAGPKITEIIDQENKLGQTGQGRETGDKALSSVDEILRARRDGQLFDYLMNRYAGQSGISGVQPKVLVQDLSKFSAALKWSQENDGAVHEGRASLTLNAATHIVKLWEPREYPELAANEYFCLLAAKRAGLTVPEFTLSESGQALVIERFDLDVDENGAGRYRGFEDFCVLNGLNAADKYSGSYEARLFRRIKDYVTPASAHEDLRALFQLFVLNAVLRNGDAHLKNFGLVYDSLGGSVRLAPVYDVITTTAYLPQDGMALTLNGTTRWPERKALERLGARYCELSPSGISNIIEQTVSAVEQTRAEMRHYFNHSPAPELGQKIDAAWEAGMKAALG